MVKVLSRAGVSLADTYDVEGSIAGIEQLESREVTLVHEMGSTIFSERYSGNIRNLSGGAVNQSTVWAKTIEDLPGFAFRVFGISVFVSAVDRITMASVAVRNPVSGREMPIWAWDVAVDVETRIQYSNDGAGASTTQFLTPRVLNTNLPHMMSGNKQPQHISSLVFRGVSSGFGAGTVTAIARIHIGFGQIGGISSKGLPIPSW